jgi:hypothetical protein
LTSEGQGSGDYGSAARAFSAQDFSAKNPWFHQQPRSVHARRNDEIHVTDLARLGGCHNEAAHAARRTSFVSTYPQEGQANIKRNPSKKQRMTMTRKEQMMKKQEMMQHNM